MSSNLSVVDYTLLAIYLAGTLALGLYIGRKVRTGEDFFLAGRRLPWWAIGMSLVATDIGGTDIIGVGGAAYTHGLAVANFEWIGCVPAMIVGAFLFIPLFWRSGIYTIPEYMERRYNAGVRSALAVCWLVFMACNLGVLLYASAKMLGALFDWNETACILATAGMVGIYTCAGGLAAVVYTDAIQCAVMIAGCLLVLVIGLIDVGGVRELYAKVAEAERRLSRDENSVSRVEGPESRAAEDRLRRFLSLDSGPSTLDSSQHTSLILPVDTKTPFPWTGIFFGLSLILSPAYWIGNQAIVQRSLGAKSEFEAKAAYVWGAVLKNVIPFIIAVPGLIAFVKFPELDDGDRAFPQLVAAVMPNGARGIFLAAFVAALMSSVDSYLNSASTIFTNDFYKRFVVRDAGETNLLWTGRIVTVVLVVWAIGFALYLRTRSESIYAIFQTMMSFFQGPALAILLAGLLWRRATGIAAFVGFVAGVLCSISLYALTHDRVLTALGWQPLFQISEPFLYFSVWAFLVSLSLVIVVSFLTKPEPEEKLAFVIAHVSRGTRA